MGWNTNAIGYPFPEGTRAVSSPSFLSLFFHSCIPILVLTSLSFEIQPIIQKHEELV